MKAAKFKTESRAKAYACKHTYFTGVRTYVFTRLGVIEWLVSETCPDDDNDWFSNVFMYTLDSTDSKNAAVIESVIRPEWVKSIDPLEQAYSNREDYKGPCFDNDLIE